MSARLVYLVRASPVDDDGVAVPQYFSAGQTNPQEYDGTEWLACLVGDPPFTLTQELPLDDLVGGASRVSFGNLTLAQEFSDLASLVALHWDARPLVIWRIEEGAAFDQDTTPPIFKGTTDTPTFLPDKVTIPLRDSSTVVDVPMQPNTYAGTGLLEGGSDLKGVRKPFLLGVGWHIEPIALDHPAPAVGEPGYARVVQFHDGPVEVTFEMYERGLRYTASSLITDVYSWTAVAGAIVMDPSAGVARTGSAPVGVLTVDAKAGDVPVDAFGNRQYTHANLARLALTVHGTVDPADIDEDALNILNAAQPHANVGIYLQDDRTIAQVLDALCQSCGAFWSFTASGTFRMRQIAFAATAADVLTADDQLTDLRSVPLPPPVWSFKMGDSPVERVLTDSDMGDAAVIPQVRTFVKEPWRYLVFENAAVHTARLLARESRNDSRFHGGVGGTDPYFEGNRQAKLVSAERECYVGTYRRGFDTRQVGDTVTLQDDDFGLASGKDFLILKKTEQPAYEAEEDAVELTFWGPCLPTDDRV